MTVHLVTFSDESMSRSADVCMASAETHGVYSVGYWPYDAPVDHPRRRNVKGFKQSTFYKQNEALLSQPRGLGYWAWKPYIIGKSMKSLIDGDILIYADAGIEFIDNVSHIIDRMDQDIFLFGNNWEHAHWCKRDIIDEIMPNGRPYVDDDKRFDFKLPSVPREFFGKQCQASVIFFRVSDYTRAFVKEWLDWCLFEGGRLIDDSPSRTPNHPEFRENRHDQAILTTMAYREGIKLHWWASVYNKGGSPEFIYERGDYPDEGYPVLFSHHRKRNIDWEQAA